MTSTNDFDRRLYTLFNEALDLSPEARSRMLEALHHEAPLLADSLARMLEVDLQGEHRSDTTASLHAALAGAVDASQPGELPARIGGYRIEGKLGEGGMGVVYLARREGLPDAPAVALKLISERLRSSAAQERFLAEQRSLARLDHPAVCRFIDADTLPDGRPLVVMEAVRGLAVDAWVATERPSVRTLLDLFIQLLSAVAHAHERLIVHRDIKCSNVLVTEGGQIKLLDFGIAKLMDEADTAQATATSDRFLTPGIAAPEYWARGEVTVATDIYALGALLYRLLSGRDPLQFDGLKPTEIERQLLFVEPDPLSKVASPIFKGQIGSDLEAIVHKCLRKSPSDRYSSADALASDLKSLIDGFPVLARPSGALYRAQLFAKRHRTGLAASFAALALLAAWAISLRASLIEAELQRETAVAERNRASMVSDILQQSILQADPARRSIEFVGAREIMAAAADRLGSIESADPRAFAELAKLIARVELEYQRNAEALDLSKRAITALGSVGDSARSNESRLVAALAAARMRNLDEAEALLEEYTSAGGMKNATYLLAEARLRAEKGEYQRAIKLTIEALQGRPDADPREHIENELRWQLAEAHYRDGNFEEMRSVLDQMLEWQRSTLPAHHAWVLKTRMQRLSALAGANGREDLDLERSALLEGHEALFGAVSLPVMMVHVRYGEALSGLGEHGGNSEALQEASRLAQKLNGPDDLLYLRLQLNLGMAYLSANTRESLLLATDVLAAAAERATQAFGSNAAITVHMRTMLARALIRSGKADLALAAVSGEFESEYERAINSVVNRRARAATLRELIEAPSLGCIGGNNSAHASCDELTSRLNLLQELNGE
jgi:hypothetical protein